MKQFRLHLLLTILLGAAAAGQAAAATNTLAETPDFKEVYDLIRAHIAGLSEAELNRAAVNGLVAALGPRVRLNVSSNAVPAQSVLGRPVVFEQNIAYVRVNYVGDGLAGQLRDACRTLGTNNQLKGLVLDLRYATGNGYASAAATADLFLAKAEPLLNWGGGMVSSQEKTNALQWPVAILVNGQTAEAAEALAAVLRARGVGLILGSQTAGRAMITKGFPLKNGGELRIATESVTLGDGPTLSTDGLKPDINVAVNGADEPAYYADSFYVLRRAPAAVSGSVTNQAAGTNVARRFRLNEAELVREHRAGIDLDDDDAPPPRPRTSEADAPVVSDPVLARALDLLKGLAVVRQARS